MIDNEHPTLKEEHHEIFERHKRENSIMGPKHQVTFEDVDKHLEAVDLTQFSQGGKLHIAHAGTATAPNICAIYKVVKPILFMVSVFPFFPPKWRDAMGLYVQAMDVICPGN